MHRRVVRGRSIFSSDGGWMLVAVCRAIQWISCSHFVISLDVDICDEDDEEEGIYKQLFPVSVC